MIEPLGEGAMQPSSVDLRVDRYFRVFRNDTTPYIDPKQAQEDLTELVEVADGEAFILHPGEFVLGSTLERVALGNDLVARLEGKSSLGRLGLLIHSSLPASEEVLVEIGGELVSRRIGELVRERPEASVVSFDPDSFEVGYHRITDFYEGPADRIFEVRLASGRSVRVTAGHNLFTLDENGALTKTRTGELAPGARVAIPRSIPDPLTARTRIEVLATISVAERGRLVCSGPTIDAVYEGRGSEVAAALKASGYSHGDDHYRARGKLPVAAAARIDGLVERLGPEDRIAARGASGSVPAVLEVNAELAWLLGLYVAEGSKRRGQVVWSNTDQAILDRVAAILRGLGISQSRAAGAITACSVALSLLFDQLGFGEGSHSKRIPPLAFGWSRGLLNALLEGLIDGDGSRERTRTSVWTCSDGLAGDLLLVAERLGLRAGSSVRERGSSHLWQIYMPTSEHKLLTSVPLPDRLLVELRELAGLDQATASRLAGYRNPTDLANIENRTGRVAVRLATLRRLRSAYERRPECEQPIDRLHRLIDGGLLWDKVVEVRDTGRTEPIYDLEVRPNGRKIENFLAGFGGVFVSNTAGFVDAGWDGHLTLELSNVANLPIAIYPGMKIGQISFLQMTTEAETPYGGSSAGSKYRGQKGPTPSRYYLNFADEREDGD